MPGVPIMKDLIAVYRIMCRSITEFDLFLNDSNLVK